MAAMAKKGEILTKIDEIYDHLCPSPPRFFKTGMVIDGHECGFLHFLVTHGITW